MNNVMKPTPTPIKVTPAMIKAGQDLCDDMMTAQLAKLGGLGGSNTDTSHLHPMALRYIEEEGLLSVECIYTVMEEARTAEEKTA